MKTKAVTISLLLFSFVCLTSCNNTGGKLEELEKQVNKIALNTANADPIYRLYPTRNMWNFLKLDTRNGKISMVQFSVEDNEKQFEYVLSNKFQIRLYARIPLREDSCFSQQRISIISSCLIKYRDRHIKYNGALKKTNVSLYL